MIDIRDNIMDYIAYWCEVNPLASEEFFLYSLKEFIDEQIDAIENQIDSKDFV